MEVTRTIKKSKYAYDNLTTIRADMARGSSPSTSTTFRALRSRCRRLERCDPVAAKDDGRRKTRPHVVEPRALVQHFVAAREVRRVAQQPRDLITRQAGVQRLNFSAQVERCGRRLKREGRVELPIG